MTYLVIALGLWLAAVGALTSFVRAAGARSRRADELADAEYQRSLKPCRWRCNACGHEFTPISTRPVRCPECGSKVFTPADVADAEYQRQAEARLRALGDEQRRYAEAVTAVRLTRVEREAEAVALEAW